MPGRLVVMGSGETSPTMIKLHRELVSASGTGPCAMLDTSFGFQANADDLTEKITGYFEESVGRSLEPARWRRRDEPVADRERTLALLRRAAFVFAGPGSPSYALRQWIDTPVPETLVDVVTRGGTAVLGSAAAATVGSHTLPVYEIYKVGEDPYWLDGLDLLGQLTGLQAAVVPHFDNREGGRHDTSFCYVGEQRFLALETQLPSTVGVLGVDEHTAVVIDTGAQTMSVYGAGAMTLRHGSVNQTFASGSVLALSDAAAVLTGAPAQRPSIPVSATAEVPETAVATSLAASAAALAARFDECLAAGDAHGALAAALDLEESIHEWSADTVQGDDMRTARQHLRSMLVALAGSAERGLGDPRDVLAPVVDVILDVRRRARETKDFATSDVIRDGLAAAGIEVRDTAEGATWELTGE